MNFTFITGIRRIRWGEMGFRGLVNRLRRFAALLRRSKWILFLDVFIENFGYLYSDEVLLKIEQGFLIQLTVCL